MTALSTMSAIIMANNPLPLKQVMHKSPPKTAPMIIPNLTPLLNESPTSPTHQNTVETKAFLNLEPNIELKLEPKFGDISGSDVISKLNSGNVEQPKVKIPKTVLTVPVVKAEVGEEKEGEGGREEGECCKEKGREGEEKKDIDREGEEADGEEEEGDEGGEGENEGIGKGRRRKRKSKDKKGSKAVNIPSIEYPVSKARQKGSILI